MERTNLSVLICEDIHELKDIILWELFDIHKKISTPLDLDVILVSVSSCENKKYQVGVIVFDTENTRKNHDGSWRYILSLQGKNYRRGSDFFTFYFLPNHTKEMVLCRFKEYFELEIQARAG